MAAPEAMLGALGRKGVRLGMSFSSFPNAPGAPAGQRGMGAFVCACASKEEQRAKRIPTLRQARFGVPASAGRTGKQSKRARNVVRTHRLKPGLQTRA